jgi:hypothetical protein
LLEQGKNTFQVQYIGHGQMTCSSDRHRPSPRYRVAGPSLLDCTAKNYLLGSSAGFTYVGTKDQLITRS